VVPPDELVTVDAEDRVGVRFVAVVEHTVVVDMRQGIQVGVGNPMVGDRDRVLQAGFDGYIPKPIAPETFVNDIEAYLKPGQARGVARVPAAEPTEDPDRHVDADRSPASRGTILVVDDVAANLELARSIFEPSGFNVRLASDVDSAMESAIENVPDLPNFSRFHDAFRENPKSKTNEGDMRTPFFLAYDAENCTHVKLNSKEIDDLVKAIKAYAYMENWPITVTQAPANGEAEFNQDIVARYKVSERGAAHAYEPRYMVKNT
jgi:CheY-like chemotaxis protein